MTDKAANQRAWVARMKQRDPERWAQLCAEQNERKAEINQVTRAVADSHYRPWTAEEDEALLRLTDENETAQTIALALGRTAWAVRTRRRKLTAV